MKPRSDFTYVVRMVKGHQFIMIEDLDRGRMSVTNDIENVVDYICNKEKLPVTTNVIYKSSDGIWDGFIYMSNQFVFLGEDSWLKAAVKFI